MWFHKKRILILRANFLYIIIVYRNIIIEYNLDNKKYEVNKMKGLLDPKVDFVFKNIFGSPKLSKESEEKDMLVAWTEFLRDPESEKVRSLEMSIEEIREAKDELIRMSNDDKQRELYEMRSKILKDKISALNEAERKGIKKGLELGREQGKEEGERNKAIEIAKNLLDVLDDKTTSLKTGLTIKQIKALRKEK